MKNKLTFSALLAIILLLSACSTDEIGKKIISTNDLLQQIPKEEKILSVQKIPDWDLLVVTKSESSEYPHGTTEAKLWRLSGDGLDKKIIKVHKFEESEEPIALEYVDMTWNSTYSPSRLDVFLRYDVPEESGGMRFIHDYVDPHFEKVIASSDYRDAWTPAFSVETDHDKYTVQLVTKNNCTKDWNDTATGLLINKTEIKFKKPHTIKCAIFGEGEPAPTMGSLDAPYFHDNFGLSFKLPWGTLVTFDLANANPSEDSSANNTVSSQDFAKTYELPTYHRKY